VTSCCIEHIEVTGLSGVESLLSSRRGRERMDARPVPASSDNPLANWLDPVGLPIDIDADRDHLGEEVSGCGYSCELGSVL
jgi:hypothetical protein